MTTHFPPLTPTPVTWKQEKNLIAKLTPKLFICLEFKTVTAQHNLVSYALLSLLFLSVQNTYHAYLESGTFPVKS